MPLQGSGKWSSTSSERSWPGVQQLPCNAGCDVAIDLILDAGAIPQLAIDRQAGHSVRLRDRRTVIGKSRRPEPFFTESKLLSDRDLTRIRKMEVGLNRPLLDGGNSDRELSERRPVLPSDIAHQAEEGWDVVEPT